MREDLIAFDGPLGTLRGVLHHPESNAPAPTVVMLHGFTGNHIESEHLFVQAARTLCVAGFAVLRFDFFGSGNSDGTFEDMTVETEIADARAALDWLSEQPGIDADRFAVVGLSLGGAVTAFVAAQDERVQAAVFWNAVALPDLHFTDIPRTGPDTGVVGGLRVSAQFLHEFAALNIVGTAEQYPSPALIVRGTGDVVVMGREAEVLAAALGDRGTLHLITNADHTFLHPEWRTELFEVTINWLRDVL